MADSIKINKLEIENVKRIKAVKIEPTKNGLTIVGGNNNQGKTSVLDSIAWALGGDRYNYKASLDDVNAKLKEFEGVDVKDLQGQITKLQGDLKAKDDEYAAKEADRVFMDSIKEAVKTAGGRNEKAVIAMLDIDALKESKNQSDDIKKALEDVKKSDGYLFGANEPINNAVGGTNISGGADPGADDVSAIRAAMGLPEKK